MPDRAATHWRSRTSAQGPGKRPEHRNREGDREFAARVAEQDRERERRTQLAKRVNANAIEASLAQRAPMRTIKGPE